MAQLKFDKKTGKLSPQKVNYVIKHNEWDEEIIDNYIENNCNFKIEYDKQGYIIFKKINKGG